MFVPLVDMLRCVKPHEETWLVASIDHAEERDIVTGALGCPICYAEYPIRNGVVYFAEREVAPDASEDETNAFRLAAALDLTDARKVAVLHGTWGAQSQLVRSVSPAHLLLVNAPSRISSGDGVSLVVADTAPLAQSSVDAVAVDARADAAMLDTLVRSLRAKGRMLGPVSLAVPDDLTELVRDDEVWVAELAVKVSVSAPVQLKRRDG